MIGLLKTMQTVLPMEFCHCHYIDLVSVGQGTVHVEHKVLTLQQLFAWRALCFRAFFMDCPSQNSVQSTWQKLLCAVDFW